MHRPLPLAPLTAAALALLLAGCPPVRGDDDDSAGCDAATGPATVQACIYYSEGDTAGIAGARLYARTGPGDDSPVEALAGEDGCLEMELPAGTWELSASNDFGDCVTPYEPFEIVGCDTAVFDFYVVMWCMDG